MTNLQKYNQATISICVCIEFTIAITKKDKDMTIILLIHALEGMCKEVTKAETKLRIR